MTIVHDPTDIEEPIEDDDAEYPAEEPDECCQRCSGMFWPDHVIILNDLGPVCRDCCKPEDIMQAIAEGTFDEECLDGQSPEEFLEEWRQDNPV